MVLHDLGRYEDAAKVFLLEIVIIDAKVEVQPYGLADDPEGRNGTNRIIPPILFSP